ncbi:MAG: 4-hydroxy-tetrahydrodipicolinate reductase [Firmicutes bacterium]|nr:4-hydroxy-tetrahydrodipicolinate reductase [Alicyclobacillaceae bacterium]MCL6497730.1 4-hydroxy-tetrahydrodipicolinate reductase [Bacillota bacterium]
MSDKIPVVLAGASGRTGMAVGRELVQAPDIELVGAIALRHRGEHLGALWNDPRLDLEVVGSLDEIPQAYAVLVDFTEPESSFERLRAAVLRGWDIVVGTTGFTLAQRSELARLVVERNVGAALIANFSVGAWVLEKVALEVSRYFDRAEVIEEHHAAKKDRPSGTALRMANLLAYSWRRDPKDIPVHSIRLPGLVAHQTVVFGASGQVVSLRHDVHDRSAYAAGVLQAVRKIHALKGRVVDDLGEVLEG